MQSAASDVSISNQSNEFLNALYDRTCTSNGDVRSDSGSIGVGSFSIGFGSSGSSASSFCKDYRNTRYSKTKIDEYKQRVSAKALDTYLECRKVAGLGITVEHRFLDVEKMNFTLGAPRNRALELRGLDAPNNVKCQTIVKKDSGDGAGTLVEIDKGTVITTKDTFTIFCTRSPDDQAGTMGQKVFEEAGITLGLGETSYSVLWPKDEVLPSALASDISAQVQGIIEALKGLRKVQPVGKDDNPQDFKCAPGQVLVGINLSLGGTCNRQCDADGRPISSISVICRDLELVNK